MCEIICYNLGWDVYDNNIFPTKIHFKPEIGDKIVPINNGNNIFEISAVVYTSYIDKKLTEEFDKEIPIILLYLKKEK